MRPDDTRVWLTKHLEAKPLAIGLSLSILIGILIIGLPGVQAQTLGPGNLHWISFVNSTLHNLIPRSSFMVSNPPSHDTLTSWSPDVQQPTSQYAWKMIVLIYGETDVRYTWKGQTYHLVARMTDEDVRRATAVVSRMVSTSYEWSAGEAVIEQTFIYPSRPIQSLTDLGENGYWVSPSDVKPELDFYAPRGKYDSIIVIWIHDHEGQAVPSYGWGWSISPHDWANGAGYSVVNIPDGHGQWPGRYPDEVFIHEWLHQVTGFYAAKGYSIPDLDKAGEYGYSVDTDNSWRQWYIDVMQGRVWDGTRYIGITREIWRSGTPTNQRATSRVLPSYTVCPSGCPFSSVRSAVEASRGGEIITIGPGTYWENLAISKNLVLRGVGRDQTFIKGANAGQPVINIESDSGSRIDVVLEGLTISEAKGPSCAAYDPLWICPEGIRVRGKVVLTVRDCQVSGNWASGFVLWGEIEARLQDSRVYANRGHGLFVWGSTIITIQNSIIEGNGTSSDCARVESVCQGIEVAEGPQMTVINSTIRNNIDWGIAAYLRKCGYSYDAFYGQVTLQGNNQIYGNNKAGNHQGELCLP